MIFPAQLAAIRERLRTANQGPWEIANGHYRKDVEALLSALEEQARELDALAQARAWLNTISGAAFFGATAPDTSSMTFTITINAAEWREIRSLVEARAALAGGEEG